MLQESGHRLLREEYQIHASLCFLFHSIFFIIISYSMSDATPYKLPKQEDTKVEHSEYEEERFTIK